MTTFAAQQDSERHLAELAARTRSAWADYSDELRELDRNEYDQREPAAWDRLQAELTAVERRRAVVAGT